MAGNDYLTAFWQRAIALWTGTMRRFAVAVVVVLVAATAVAVWYTAKHLAVETGTADMISAETPFRRNAIAFDKAFPQFGDQIVIVIDAPNPEAANAAAARLTAALRKKPALFDHVDWPAGEPYFTRNGLLFFELDALSRLGDRLAQAAPLLTALARSPDLKGLFGVLTLALREGGDDPQTVALIERIGEIAAAQRAGQPATLSWRKLSGLGGDSRHIVLAHPVLDAGSLTPGDAALSAVRETASRLGIGEGVRLRLTGSVALDNEELKSAAVGGKTAALLSLTLVTLLMIVGLRSLWLILPALITLLAGLVWTAAFAALAVGHLNLISVAFAVLFVGLGIDFSIHYCLRYREALGEATGSDPLETTAVQTGGSLALAALCAALGFLSFLPTAYKGLAELGVISAGGMAIAFLLNLTLLPALLTLFPSPRPARGRGVTIVAPPSVVVIAILLAIAGCVSIPFLRFDFNPMNLKDPTSESVRTFHDLARDGQNGIYTIDLLTANRTAATAAAARMQKLPEVGRTVTIDSLIPSDQPEKLGLIEDMAFFLAPALTPPTTPAVSGANERQTALRTFRAALQSIAEKAPGTPLATAASHTENALAALAAGGDHAAAELERRLTVYLPGMLKDLRQALNAQPVTFDDLPRRLRDSWIAADGRARLQLWPARPLEGNADIRRFARAVLAQAPEAVGTPVTIAEAGDAVVKAFREATVIAFIAVTIVLLVLLRSTADTALVLFPLVLAASYTGATSYVFGRPFNFANVIVLPLLFGLGVASGVHIVTRARGAADTTALMHTSTPRAVLFSALTTIASFGSLALSGHRGMTSMGQLLTIAVVYTLVCTLIVLPALLRWLERRSGH